MKLNIHATAKGVFLMEDSMNQTLITVNGDDIKNPIFCHYAEDNYAIFFRPLSAGDFVSIVNNTMRLDGTVQDGYFTGTFEGAYRTLNVYEGTATPLGGGYLASGIKAGEYGMYPEPASLTLSSIEDSKGNKYSTIEEYEDSRKTANNKVSRLASKKEGFVKALITSGHNPLPALRQKYTNSHWEFNGESVVEIRPAQYGEDSTHNMRVEYNKDGEVFTCLNT